MDTYSQVPPCEAAAGTSTDTALRAMLAPLTAYLSDEAVREIAVVRPHCAFLRLAGRWQQAHVPALSYDYIEALVAAVASYNDMPSSPILSMRLPDGERVQVVQPPAVIQGTIALNIRKHSPLVKSLDQLQEEGALAHWRAARSLSAGQRPLTAEDEELLALMDSGDILAFLRQAVLYRRNMMIAGKTGSGKTTFARSLIQLVPTHERLLTVEDAHELYLPEHPNRLHLMYGKPAEGKVGVTDCIAACMRLSPDRIFLSELRGPEAWDYLQALNTGHPGSITTLHANSPFDAYDRVALMVKQSEAGATIDLQTIRAFLHATIDISLYYADYKLVEVYFDPKRPITT